MILGLTCQFHNGKSSLHPSFFIFLILWLRWAEVYQLPVFVQIIIVFLVLSLQVILANFDGLDEVAEVKLASEFVVAHLKDVEDHLLALWFVFEPPKALKNRVSLQVRYHYVQSGRLKLFV